jgi:phospholipid/cholesterol/gamma-HCH transport system ATP-binding protein
MVPLVSLKDAWFSYPAVPHSEAALKAITLTISPGETLGLIGPSGAGKTTLLKLMAGLYLPLQGTVHFQGKGWESLSRQECATARRKLAMTFQRSGLFDSLSCGDNLRLPLREVLRLSSKKTEQKLKQALKEVGLEGIENRAVSEISGGMQKRLGMARALLFEPKFILFDDPTAGLDPITARSIEEVMLSIRKSHAVSAVFVTSELRQAYRLADQLCFLHHGEIREQGSVTDVRATKNPIVRQFLDGSLEGPLTREGRS